MVVMRLFVWCLIAGIFAYAGCTHCENAIARIVETAGSLNSCLYCSMSGVSNENISLLSDETVSRLLNRLHFAVEQARQ